MQESGAAGELSCRVAGRCSGCAWIGEPLEEQRARRVATLVEAWSAHEGLPALTCDVVIHDVMGGWGFRERLDMSVQRAHEDDERAVVGLYDRDVQGELVSMEGCPLATPALRAWLDEVCAHPPPRLLKASLRLRVAPDGARGLWLDASNEGIKALMDEGVWLRWAMERAHVELGQRRKPLYEEEGRLRLAKQPHQHGWVETTYDGGAQHARLYGSVGAFTQPGSAAIKALVSRVEAQLEALPHYASLRWLELGAGQGALTLALAARSARVVAAELDEAAVEGLARTLQECGLGERVEVVQHNMYRAQARPPGGWELMDGLLVDPPRSGLGKFLDTLAESASKPRHIIYVSCYQDSLISDAARLYALGYEVVVVEGIDQFAHSPHGEWLVRFELSQSVSMAAEEE